MDDLHSRMTPRPHGIVASTRLAALAVVGLLALTSCASASAAFVEAPDDPVFTALYLEDAPPESDEISGACEALLATFEDVLLERSDFASSIYLAFPIEEDDDHCLISYEMTGFRFLLRLGVNPLPDDAREEYRSVLSDSGPLDVCEFYEDIGADELMRPDDFGTFVVESSKAELSEDGRSCGFLVEAPDTLRLQTVYLTRSTQIAVATTLFADPVRKLHHSEFDDLTDVFLEKVVDSL